MLPPPMPCTWEVATGPAVVLIARTSGYGLGKTLSLCEFAVPADAGCQSGGPCFAGMVRFVSDRGTAVGPRGERPDVGRCAMDRSAAARFGRGLRPDRVETGGPLRGGRDTGRQPLADRTGPEGAAGIAVPFEPSVEGGAAAGCACTPAANAALSDRPTTRTGTSGSASRRTNGSAPSRHRRPSGWKTPRSTFPKRLSHWNRPAPRFCPLS
jgi:hypothetical protein